MARSLAERLRAHEQQKARLAEQEAKLKADERKARTRQLIQAGGLIAKAGLLELEPNALYGALLSLRDSASDPEQLRQWAALGGRAFAREARLALEGKEAIVWRVRRASQVSLAALMAAACSCSPSPPPSAAMRRPHCVASASGSNDAAPLLVIDALDACVAAEDVMARLYRPAPSAPHDDAAVLASMRNWFPQSKLPSPVTRDDGFRAVAADLARRGPRRRERTTLCDLAAIFASRESALAAERGGRNGPRLSPLRSADTRQNLAGMGKRPLPCPMQSAACRIC